MRRGEETHVGARGPGPLGAAVEGSAPLQPVATAFARRLRWTAILCAAATFAGFTFLTEELRSASQQEYLAQQAALCRAALDPGPNGSYADAVDRLRMRYEPLIAVATLNVSGGVESVHPNRPAHRQLAEDALDARGSVIKMPAPETGVPTDVVGVVRPLNDSGSPTARRALFLFRAPRCGREWRSATLTFGLLLVGVGLTGVVSVRRWFDRRVVARLRQMARGVRGLAGPPQRRAFVEPGEWRETVEIAERLDELMGELAEADRRTRRAIRESQRAMKRRERGFDLELRRVRDKATTDALTKLRNRAFFEEQLETIFLDHHKRSADMAVVMIDVDNFKQYNDMHGHQVGDALLKFVGALLRGAIRPEDYAVRYGGDEFVLMLVETDARQATTIAERIVKLFSQYVSGMPKDHNLTLSAGVASRCAYGSGSGQELVAMADEALYAAKRRGKNATAVYTWTRRPSEAGPPAPTAFAAPRFEPVPRTS